MMSIHRFGAVHEREATCACGCRRKIRDGDLVQVFLVDGARPGRVRQVVRLACITSIVENLVQTERRDIAREFEEIRRSFSESMKYE